MQSLPPPHWQMNGASGSLAFVQVPSWNTAVATPAVEVCPMLVLENTVQSNATHQTEMYFAFIIYIFEKS